MDNVKCYRISGDFGCLNSSSIYYVILAESLTSLTLFPHLVSEKAHSRLINPLGGRILITLAKYLVMVRAKEMGIIK